MSATMSTVSTPSGQQQQYTPPPPSSSYPPSEGSEGQIGVHSTIHIVLISFGIAVGALILLGAAAAYYISRKNKRRKQEESRLPAVPPGSADQREGETTTSERRTEDDDDGLSNGCAEKSPRHHPASMDKKAGTGAGYMPMRPGAPGIKSVLDSRCATNPFTTSRGSQSGSSDLSTMEAVASAAAWEDAGHFDPRNSIIDVAQVYARRQSLVDPLEPSTDGRISTVVDPSRTRAFYDDSLVTPPISEGSNSHLVDPFKTNNNSTTSISPSVDHNEALSSQRMNASYSWVHESNAQEMMITIGSPVPTEDWHYQKLRQDDNTLGYNMSYQYSTVQPPVSAPMVLSGDISYQPPSQPTSPIERYDQPRLRGRRSFAELHIDDANTSIPRTFRDGAAVFEGVAVSRANKNRSPSRPGFEDTERNESIGRVFDTLGSPLSPQQQQTYRRQKWAGGSGSGIGVDTRRPADGESESVIVSLPSPRGCLLEAEGAEESSKHHQYLEQGENIHYLEYGFYPQQRGLRQPFHTVSHSGDEDDNNTSPYPYPKIVRRAPRQNNEGRAAVKSSYLDDYREQQQRKSLWSSAV
ncbi:hypothetical protein EDD21DRAFT_402879 [Dissophora ornata]|nr:hypothetical protein EDD21DRAFT_402879 [Dissophora ornata]